MTPIPYGNPQILRTLTGTLQKPLYILEPYQALNLKILEP